MHRKLAIALLSAASAGLLAHGLITTPPQKPKGRIGAPYLVPDPPCATHQDSCALCFVEELARLMRTGKVPRDERRLADKLAWARKFKAEECAGRRLVGDGGQRHSTVGGGMKSNPCNGKRDICATGTIGRVEFTVHSGRIVGDSCLACQGKGQPLFAKQIPADYTSWGNRSHLPVFLPQLATIRESDENILDLSNELYSKWTQAMPDEVPPSVPYRIVVPGAPANAGVHASDRRTWLLDPLGSEKEGIAELSAFDARWFDAYDDKDPYAGRFLYDLSCAFACYEKTILQDIATDRSNSMVKAARGTYLGHPFLFGTGYVEKQGLLTFFPVRAGNITGAVINASTRGGSITDKRIHDLFRQWTATGKTSQVICSALPHSREGGTPWNDIGRPRGTQQVSDAMLQRINAARAEDLDYLIQDGAAYWAQRSSSAPQQVKWLKGKVDTRHTRMLAIAHPRLNILAKREEAGRTVVVFTWPSASAIYSWSWSGTDAPTERTLLSTSTDAFALTGASVAAYISSLVARTPTEEDRLTDREAELFLSLAMGSESSAEVIWLDWFEAEQVVLFAQASPFKDKDGSIALQFERLGPNAMGGGSEKQFIKLTDAGSTTSLIAYRERYQSTTRDSWKREKFAQVILTNIGAQDFWLSKERSDRVGRVRRLGNGSADLSVFTNGSERSVFGPARWTSMQQMIRKDQVVYHVNGSDFGSVPNHPFELFKACLSNADAKPWTESANWRANPLGYFDRVPNTRL